MEVIDLWLLQGLVTECSDCVLKAAQMNNQATNPNCGESQKMMSLSE